MKDDNVPLSLGDDAAALKCSAGKSQLLTVDTLVSGTHFLDIAEDYFNIGRKALLVNISDIAAMAGIPRYFLLSLVIPENLGFDKIMNLIEGMARVSRENRLVLLGGDCVSGPALTISITLIGETESGQGIARNNIQAGDGLFLTGTTGEAAAGLKYLTEDRTRLSNAQSELIRRHLTPPNHVKTARFLKNNFSLGGLLDLSDGLYEGIKELVLANDLGFLINWDKIPVSELLKDNFTEKQIEEFLFYGGEDYELLFTAPLKDSTDIISQSFEELGIKISLIGEAKPPNFGIKLVQNGKTRELSGAGFKHFNF